MTTICDGINQQISGFQQQIAKLQAMQDDPEKACQEVGVSGSDCMLFIKSIGGRIHHAEDQIAALQTQLAQLNNCAPTELIRSLTGPVTLCTDSSFVPGPKSTSVNATLDINSANGNVICLLNPFLIDGISISFQPNSTGTGKYDLNTGSLELSLPLQATNVPLFGDTLTTTFNLSTQTSLSPSCASDGPFVGSPAASPPNATGAITLVGTGSVQALGGTINGQLRMTGMLQV